MPIVGPKASHGILLCILLLWAAGAMRLFYASGSGEHDTFMMSAAIVRGAQTGQVINVFCYGERLQFLFYYLFWTITHLFEPTTGRVLLVMNTMGAASALVTPLLMLRVFSSLFGDRTRSELSVLLFVTSPLYFFTLSYGHPFLLALPVLLVAWVALLAALDEARHVRALLLLVVAVSLQSSALMIRFEQIGLFSGLLIGLLAVRQRRRLKALVLAGGVLAVSCIVFWVVRFLLLDTPAAPPEPASPLVSGTILVLLRILDPGLVKWGLPHIVVGVGPGLLLLAVVALAICARLRRYEPVILLVTGVAPSLLIYLGNPSPPRHFYVLTVGLACFVAASLDIKGIALGRRAAAGVLAISLIAPWALVLVDGQPYPQRANVAYNVIQRTDRNRAEIADAALLYPRIVEAARRGPIVVFGSWVHIAQMTALLANDPTWELTRTQLSGGFPALQLRNRNITLYLIETYDHDFAVKAARQIRSAALGLRCISLVEGSTSINDLNLIIPVTLLWWNA